MLHSYLVQKKGPKENYEDENLNEIKITILNLIYMYTCHERKVNQFN